MSVKTIKEDSITIVEQEKFYGDKLAPLLGIIILLLVFVLGILIFSFYLFRLQSPPPQFFQASARAELIPQIPLNEPNMAPNALLNWVTESMMDVNTFNFVNYNDVIESGRQYFTVEGFESFKAALKNARVLDKVIDNKYVLRAQATESPQVTKEGVLANRYLWKIKLTMDFKYKNVSTSTFEDADIVLLVMRVPNSQSPFGVRILKYDLTLKRPTL